MHAYKTGTLKQPREEELGSSVPPSPKHSSIIEVALEIGTSSPTLGGDGSYILRDVKPPENGRGS